MNMSLRTTISFSLLLATAMGMTAFGIPFGEWNRLSLDKKGDLIHRSWLLKNERDFIKRRIEDGVYQLLYKRLKMYPRVPYTIPVTREDLMRQVTKRIVQELKHGEAIEDLKKRGKDQLDDIERSRMWNKKDALLRFRYRKGNMYVARLQFVYDVLKHHGEIDKSINKSLQRRLNACKIPKQLSDTEDLDKRFNVQAHRANVVIKDLFASLYDQESDDVGSQQKAPVASERKTKSPAEKPLYPKIGAKASSTTEQVTAQQIAQMYMDSKSESEPESPKVNTTMKYIAPGAPKSPKVNTTMKYIAPGADRSKVQSRNGMYPSQRLVGRLQNTPGPSDSNGKGAGSMQSAWQKSVRQRYNNMKHAWQRQPASSNDNRPMTRNQRAVMENRWRSGRA